VGEDWWERIGGRGLVGEVWWERIGGRGLGRERIGKGEDWEGSGRECRGEAKRLGVGGVRAGGQVQGSEGKMASAGDSCGEIRVERFV
jgi:hypothetical protein